MFTWGTYKNTVNNRINSENVEWILLYTTCMKYVEITTSPGSLTYFSLDYRFEIRDAHLLTMR